MKNDFPNSTPPLPGSERFVHAALEEHARIGSKSNDDALVNRILLETVHKEAVISPSAAENSSLWKSMLIGVTSAAAALALGFFALQSFHLRDSVRQEEEVHFVVRILEDSPASVSTATAGAPTVLARPNEAPIEPTFAKVDAVVGPNSVGSDYLLETQFGRSLAPFPARAHRHNRFLISAEKVSQASHETRFDGQVVIAHNTWRIEAQSASVPNAGNVGGNSETPSPSLSAFDVVVTQENPRRTVHASELTFDAVSGNLILTGVELLSAAEGEMQKFQSSDRLTLSETSYAIESVPLEKYASPRLVKPGKN